MQLSLLVVQQACHFLQMHSELRVAPGQLDGDAGCRLLEGRPDAAASSNSREAGWIHIIPGLEHKLPRLVLPVCSTADRACGQLHLCRSVQVLQGVFGLRSPLPGVSIHRHELDGYIKVLHCLCMHDHTQSKPSTGGAWASLGSGMGWLVRSPFPPQLLHGGGMHPGPAAAQTPAVMGSSGHSAPCRQGICCTWSTSLSQSTHSSRLDLDNRGHGPAAST